ncbi:MAG: hypothetical protein QG636_48 [Patescibacteria group bacterium]|jgi:hypothetical protein|nr:hypothetical protein [Patescibacteria group bacterium]
MTKTNILGAVASIALILGAGSAAAQVIPSSVPARQADQTLPRQIIVDMSSPLPGGQPLPMQAYNVRGVLRTTSLDDWKAAYGDTPESIALYQEYASAGENACTIAGEDVNELAEIMGLIAQLDPMYLSLFNRYDINLSEHIRRSGRVGGAANFLQALLGLIQIIRNPEDLLEHGIMVVAGAGSNEVRRQGDQYAQELSRESNMLSLLFNRLSIRANLLWGRSERAWLEQVYPTCVGMYPALANPATIPTLPLDETITDPIRNGIVRR